jgi:hypothetical protein
MLKSKLLILLGLMIGTAAQAQFQYEEDPFGNNQQQNDYGDYDIQTRPLNYRSQEGYPLELGILKTVQESTGQRLVGLVLKAVDIDVVSLPNHGYNVLQVEADGQVIEQQYLNQGQQMVRVRLPYPQVIGGQGIRRLALSINGNVIVGSIRLRVSNSGGYPGPGPGPRPDPDYGPLVVTDKVLSSYHERMSLYDLIVSEWQYPNPNRYVRQLSVQARSYGGVYRPGGRLMVIVRGRGNVLTMDIRNSSYPQTIQLPSTPLEDISFRVIGSDIYLEQLIIR